MSDNRPPEPKSYFGDSNEVDPTPGWIPFVFVIAIAVVFAMAFVFIVLFMR